MRKIAFSIVLFGWLCMMSGCVSVVSSSGGNGRTTAATTHPTTAPIAVSEGDSFEAVGMFSETLSPVWSYVSAAPERPLQWERMTVFVRDEGAGLSAFAPTAAQEAWVGVSAALPSYLELHGAGADGRIGGVRFVAPTAATYRVCGVIRNEWDEPTDGLCLSVGEETRLTVPCEGETPFETAVLLAAGESVTVFVPPAVVGDPISVYLKLTVTVEKLLD